MQGDPGSFGNDGEYEKRNGTTHRKMQGDPGSFGNDGKYERINGATHKIWRWIRK